MGSRSSLLARVPARLCSLAVCVLLMGGFAPANLAAEEVAFGSIGLQVVPTITGELVVLNVLPGSPAAQRGLSPGDLIFRVDDFPLHGSDFGMVVAEHLWGPVGSPVELHYRRPGQSGECRISLFRSAQDPRLTLSPSVQAAPADGSKGN